MYINGEVYEGKWKDDKREGRGILTQGTTISHLTSNISLANDNWYEGEWKNDMRHGKGTFYYASSRQRYDAMWAEGVAVKGMLRAMESWDEKRIPPKTETVKVPTKLPQLELLNPYETIGLEEYKRKRVNLSSFRTNRSSADKIVALWLNPSSRRPSVSKNIV